MTTTKTTSIRHELMQPANLVSLLRVPLALVLGYFLTLPGNTAVIIAAVVMIVAGITDALDGYLARKSGHITKLGIMLDPICDKIFAGLLVIFLILYRDFPIWFAASVIGRDLLILLGGLVLRGRQDIAIPSNLTGKYAFAAVASAAGSYVIRFEFGIALLTWIAVVLLIASTIVYGRVFVKVFRNQPVPQFTDRPYLKAIRLILTYGITAVYLFRLYTDLIV